MANEIREGSENPDNERTIAEANEEMMRSLPPLANTIVDAAIDNMTRKLIAGYRNKNNARPNAKQINIGAEAKETLKAVSAVSVMEVANRGQAWKELIIKSFTSGITSLSTIKFDGQFTVRNGKPDESFQSFPEGPGVYVVYDQHNKPVYVGDSGNMKKRWYAGHLNEYRQGEKNGKPHKLALEFSEGCTVRFIRMDSVETAAALEAQLIRENFGRFPDVPKNPTEDQRKQRSQAVEGGMLKNNKEELKAKQGKRSNIEAKKMKDSLESTASLVMGAGGDAFKNVGFDLVHRLTTTTIKAVKDELVDILLGKEAKIVTRVRRLMKKIFAVLRGCFELPLQLLRGIVEFIVNAVSKTIGAIYNLARNIFDLANNTWNLYQGSQAMPHEELVRKVSETVIVGGSLVVWDAVDPVIEAKLTTVVGPFAPYLSCAIVAVGFGLTSYSLQSIVSKIVGAVVAFKQGLLASLDAARDACEQLIRNAEMELRLIADLGEYLESTLDLMDQMREHTRLLSAHEPIQAIDYAAMLSFRGGQGIKS